MSENYNSLNSDFNKSSNHNNSDEGVKSEFNKSRIPDFQFLPPTPPTPPPAIIIYSSVNTNSSGSGNS
jgi:hypothetical protein